MLHAAASAERDNNEDADDDGGQKRVGKHHITSPAAIIKVSSSERRIIDIAFYLSPSCAYEIRPNKVNLCKKGGGGHVFFLYFYFMESGREDFHIKHLDLPQSRQFIHAGEMLTPTRR